MNLLILGTETFHMYCNVCNGTGQVMKVTNTILGRMQSTSICDNCSGTGKIVSNRPPGSIIPYLIIKLTGL